VLAGPGLPDGVYLQTKNPDLGKFWRALAWKRLVYSKGVWNKLRPFGIFYGHLVILWQFGTFSTVLVYCVEKNLATLYDSYSFNSLRMLFLLGERKYTKWGAAMAQWYLE
jgi:hypothetical protein